MSYFKELYSDMRRSRTATSVFYRTSKRRLRKPLLVRFVRFSLISFLVLSLGSVFVLRWAPVPKSAHMLADQYLNDQPLEYQWMPVENMSPVDDDSVSGDELENKLSFVVLVLVPEPREVPLSPESKEDIQSAVVVLESVVVVMGPSSQPLVPLAPESKEDIQSVDVDVDIVFCLLLFFWTR